MDEQLLREFLAEAEDLIEVLAGDIQALRSRRSEGRARRELVARIFRHVHTIKGSAAAVGLTLMAELAHEFENLLEGVRLGRVGVDDSVLDAFDEAASTLEQTLSAAVRGDALPAPGTLTERLRRLSLQSGAQQQASAGSDVIAALPDEMARSLSEYEAHRLREAAGEGAHLFLINVQFDLLTFDERFRDFSDALSADGEIISTMPGMEASAPDQISFRLLYATDAGFDEVAERASVFGASAPLELTSEQSARPVESGAEAAPDEARAEDDELPQGLASLSTLVRVELSELDEMVSAAHELLTDTATTLDLALAANLQRAERTELEIRSARIRRRFTELEERLIEMRMVAIATTLTRAVRVGSASARAVGKEVEFEMEGGEVRLDKSLADRMADPLLHLLRNAIDHAIEPYEERLRQGKPPVGRVRLEAFSEGSRVRLRISDDGRGIDVERVRRAGIERGIIEAGQELTRQQSLRLIFRPGFSTTSAVSNMSGRGVGLDVVEKAVEQVGGELRVESEQGRGTTFELILPTTLALVPALVVQSAGFRYCVDASHIAEAGFIETGEIERVGSSRLMRWRGSILPLFSMRRLLAQPEAEEANDGRAHVLISRIASGDGAPDDNEDQARRAAVVVDGWDGHREVLVRGLGSHASRWRGISGATELQDGTVALILDLPRLLESAV
ncbi:MAG TPA: chemotaxis protein CheA [Pyrinomonadaceae bacterium]|jgi:two-component system chemotaxis sensor kinase CheA